MPIDPTVQTRREEEARSPAGVAVRRASVVAAVVQMAAAAYVIADSVKFPYWDPQTGPGAGFLPLWIGGIWFVVAAALAWQGRAAGGDGETAPVPAGPEGRRLLAAAGMIVAFALLFEPLGALLSVAAFATAMLRLFERYPWRGALMTGAVISVVLYLVFATWLHVPLPRGVFFFL